MTSKGHCEEYYQINTELTKNFQGIYQFERKDIHIHKLNKSSFRFT